MAFCFLGTGVFIYLQADRRYANKPVRLDTALSSIAGWKTGQATPMDPRAVQELETDDYLFRDYTSREGAVNLYIGYYFSAEKVGASHDPLVCFPGQGWAISKRGKGKLTLSQKLGEAVVYSRMLAERDSQEVLIVYWFQSYDETNADTLSQKLTLFWKKLTQKRGDNAFVRVSIVLGDRAMDQGMDVISNFIEAFYPVFLRFIRQGEENG